MNMAARLIVARGMPDGQDLRAYLLDREISKDPLSPLVDALVDIAVAAMAALLMDIVD